MISLSCCNFFKFFIYHPNSTLLSLKDQKIARIARKTLSILSLTLIPRFCKAVWSNRKVWSQKEKTILCGNIKALIQSSRTSPLSDSKADKEKSSDANKVSCDPILHGLYLGNAQGFVEATDLAFPCGDQTMQNSNSHRFNSVITYCSIGNMIGYCSLYIKGCDIQKLTEVSANLSFANQKVDGRKVNWLNHGRTAMDCPEGWLGIVHDSTFPNTDLGSAANVTVNQVDEMLAEKGNIIQGTNVENWFQEAFKEIDGAVFHNKRVLVHCQMGISRSSSVLAASYKSI
jgi:hypothetical protein